MSSRVAQTTRDLSRGERSRYRQLSDAVSLCEVPHSVRDDSAFLLYLVTSALRAENILAHPFAPCRTLLRWGNYFYFMAPFGIIGGLLIMSILGRVTLAKQPRAVSPA